MDEPTPKRRRVSPRFSDVASGDAPAQASTAQLARPRSKRPSFASPTKASMARSNPQILERRRSSSPSKADNPTSHARRSGETGSRRGRRRSSGIRQTERASDPTGAPASEPRASERAEDEHEMEDAEGGVTSSGRPVRRLRGGLAAAPQRSPLKPSPRPLPPPGPEGEDELSPFVGRDLSRHPRTGIDLSRPEPELPPSVPDAISSSSPRGIHNSPSRWRDKAQPKKSSPLKRMQHATTREPSKPRSSFLRRLKGLQDADDADDPDPLLDQSTHRARRIPAFDANAGKKREKDALLHEIASLKKDLETLGRENKRIRAMQDAARVLAPSNSSAVLDVVLRHLMPEDANAQLVNSRALLEAALNPVAVFPFGGLLATATTADEVDDAAVMKSHHPVPLSAEDELPYLQLFSPFEIMSDVAVLPSTQDEPLRQRHAITLRARDAPGMFRAKIEMIVNATDLAIVDLRVPFIPAAARAELDPFVRKICSGDCNRSMQRNVGNLAWAMAEWYRASMQRATFWTRLDRELAKDSILDTMSKFRVRMTKSRCSPADDVAEPDGKRAEKGAEVDEGAGVFRPRGREILQFMGQQHFEITVPPRSKPNFASTLRLEWKISFDWTGEAQNNLTVKLGVPGHCKSPLTPSKTVNFLLTFNSRALHR